MPVEQNRGYMNNHLTPAQLRLNAERDNMSYASKGAMSNAQSRGSRGLPPLNDPSNYNANNYQNYKIGLSGQYQARDNKRLINIAPPIINTHADARRNHIEQKRSPNWWQ